MVTEIEKSWKGIIKIKIEDQSWFSLPSYVVQIDIEQIEVPIVRKQINNYL
jgi:hypothetical protein